MNSKHILFFALILITIISCNNKTEDNIENIIIEKDSTNYIEDASPKSYIPQINDTIAETRKINLYFNRRCYFIIFSSIATDLLIISFFKVFEIILLISNEEKGATTFLSVFNTFFF